MITHYDKFAETIDHLAIKNNLRTYSYLFDVLYIDLLS